MKTLLEIVELKNDIVTTSTGCEFEACPGAEFDEYAMEG